MSKKTKSHKYIFDTPGLAKALRVEDADAATRKINQIGIESIESFLFGKEVAVFLKNRAGFIITTTFDACEQDCNLSFDEFLWKYEDETWIGAEKLAVEVIQDE